MGKGLSPDASAASRHRWENPGAVSDDG